ncbi:ribosome recycling factor [Xylariaceae sp. AK1471]|nr:ribosome recycling factor [Xylariaceae sp. AK1471]
MSNVVTRALLRQRFAQPQTGRVYVRPIGPRNILAHAHNNSYDVARASIATSAAAPYSIRPICQRCLRSLPAAPSLALGLPRGLRALHVSPTVYKSKKKEEKEKRADAGRATNNNSNGKPSPTESKNTTSTDDGPKHPQPSPEEPLNFADVKSRLRKHAEHFRASFKKLHTSGRFDPDVIGALRVTVDKKEGIVYPLRELAQVVPRGGRAVSLLVHDDEYVKPIMSAVQSSPEFNQQPQRDADNELELVLKIEPEKREDLVKRVKATAHEWRERVRAVRQKRDKLHATWKKDGTLGPDLKRTADKELDKVIKATTAEIDDAEKSAIKVAESK